MKKINLLLIAMLIGKVSYSQITFTVFSSSGGFSLSCTVPLLSMNVSSSFSNNVNYLWSTPSQGTLYTNNYTVWNDPGVYTITATSGTLSSTQTVVITLDKTPPSVSVTSSSNSITCLNYSFVLTANTTPTNITYSWIEPGVGLGCTGYTCFGANAGTYAAIATNIKNGCKDTAKITIYDGRVFPIMTTSDLFTVACPNGTVDLVPVITSPSTGLTYSWNAPPNANTSATNSLILNTNAPGVYTFTATHTLTGCSSKAHILVYACVGLKEESVIIKRLYPNPFKNIIHMDYISQVNGVSVQVINIFGHTVYEETFSYSPDLLNLFMLSNGMYYLRVISSEGSHSVKILKE
jgi:hypothetical protein